MQLVALGITARREGADPVILTQASDVTSFQILQRPNMAQFITFAFRHFCKIAKPGTRTSTKHEAQMVYVYMRGDGLAAAAVVSDGIAAAAAVRRCRSCFLSSGVRNFSPAASH